MTKNQLKEIIKECLLEVFQDKNLLTTLVAESIKTSVVAILAEVQKPQQTTQTINQVPKQFQQQPVKTAQKSSGPDLKRIYEGMKTQSPDLSRRAAAQMGVDIDDVERSRQAIKNEVKQIKQAAPAQVQQPRQTLQEQQKAAINQTKKFISPEKGLEMDKFLAAGGVKNMATVLSNSSLWEEEENKQPFNSNDIDSQVPDEALFGGGFFK